MTSTGLVDVLIRDQAYYFFGSVFGLYTCILDSNVAFHLPETFFSVPFKSSLTHIDHIPN